MLEELWGDNRQLLSGFRAAHRLAHEGRDIATASLIETWIDEAEGRVWFLSEIAARFSEDGGRL